MGFVCKVIIYATYARHHGLTNFNFPVTLIPLFQLCDCSALITVMCLVICLTNVSLQVLQKVDISANFAAVTYTP